MKFTLRIDTIIIQVKLSLLLVYMAEFMDVYIL